MTVTQVKKFNDRDVYIGMSKNRYGKTYFARRDFKKGEVVMAGFGKIIHHQTPHISVQIDKNKYYLPKSFTGRYWNHSCDPNTYMKTRVDGFPNLIALKSIKRGQEITYSYWMSEFSWTKDADESRIRCKCGSKNCRGKILSFSQLPKNDQEKLVHKKMCARYLCVQFYNSIANESLDASSVSKSAARFKINHAQIHARYNKHRTVSKKILLV